MGGVHGACMAPAWGLHWACTGLHGTAWADGRPACAPAAAPAPPCRHPYASGGDAAGDDGNARLLWVHFLLVVLYCAYAMWLLDGHYKWWASFLRVPGLIVRRPADGRSAASRCNACQAEAMRHLTPLPNPLPPGTSCCASTT
jgi:hypothetical protein